MELSKEEAVRLEVVKILISSGSASMIQGEGALAAKAEEYTKYILGIKTRKPRKTDKS